MNYELTSNTSLSRMLPYTGKANSIASDMRHSQTFASTDYVQYYVDGCNKIYYYRTNLPDYEEKHIKPAPGKTVTLVSLLIVTAAVFIYGTTKGF